MGQFTNVVKTDILNYYFVATAHALVGGGVGTTYQCRLYTTAWTDAAAGTEQTEGGYAAQTFAFDSAVVSGNGYMVDNTALISFGPATGAWAQTTYFAVWNEEGTPEYLAWAALTTPRTLATDDKLEFAAGALVVSLDTA